MDNLFLDTFIFTDATLSNFERTRDKGYTSFDGVVDFKNKVEAMLNSPQLLKSEYFLPLEVELLEGLVTNYYDTISIELVDHLSAKSKVRQLFSKLPKQEGVSGVAYHTVRHVMYSRYADECSCTTNLEDYFETYVRGLVSRRDKYGAPLIVFVNKVLSYDAEIDAYVSSLLARENIPVVIACNFNEFVLPEHGNNTSATSVTHEANGYTYTEVLGNGDGKGYKLSKVKSVIENT